MRNRHWPFIMSLETRRAAKAPHAPYDLKKSPDPPKRMRAHGTKAGPTNPRNVCGHRLLGREGLVQKRLLRPKLIVVLRG